MELRFFHSNMSFFVCTGIRTMEMNNDKKNFEKSVLGL